MAKETASKPTTSSESSWWSERGKITGKKSETEAAETTGRRSETEATKPTARKSETGAAKPKKKVRTKKATKAESGQTYYCEVCGCEMVCASDSAGEVVCCEEPMYLVVV